MLASLPPQQRYFQLAFHPPDSTANLHLTHPTTSFLHLNSSSRLLLHFNTGGMPPIKRPASALLCRAWSSVLSQSTCCWRLFCVLRRDLWDVRVLKLLYNARRCANPLFEAVHTCTTDEQLGAMAALRRRTPRLVLLVAAPGRSKGTGPGKTGAGGEAGTTRCLRQPVVPAPTADRIAHAPEQHTL